MDFIRVLMVGSGPMIQIQYTYDRVTPESAEVGDCAEHGFWDHGGWEYPVGGCETDPAECIDVHAPGAVPAKSECADVAEAADEILQVCGCGTAEFNGAHLSFYGSDSDTDFRTGAETRYSAHIDALEPETRAKLAHCLADRGCYVQVDGRTLES